MSDPSELRQPACLAQLAEVKRSARGVAPVVACSEHPPELPSPWQFRLRTVFAVVAGLSGLFAIMHLIGAMWSAILVWFLILAMAHVTANFWGTRVAPRQSELPTGDGRPDGAGPAHPSTVAIGAVRLRENRRPGWPMLVTTAIGVLVGGTLGGIALISLSLDSAGYAGVVVGTISAAVVGGFLGFLTSSFAVIASRAWKEALSGSLECGDSSPLSLVAERPSFSSEPNKKPCGPEEEQTKDVLPPLQRDQRFPTRSFD